MNKDKLIRKQQILSMKLSHYFIAKKYETYNETSPCDSHTEQKQSSQ